MTQLPVVRVDNWLLWPGGHSREMTREERLRWSFGKRHFNREASQRMIGDVVISGGLITLLVIVILIVILVKLLR